MAAVDVVSYVAEYTGIAVGLAIVGYEAIAIGIILVAIFIWGPNKIPELARSLGRARREFDEASRGLVIGPTNPTPRIEAGSSDQLIETARNLGISTEGKTRKFPTRL